MSNSAQTSASNRINALLDENSFVEVGAYITARNTDFNMTSRETPADGVVTGYGTIEGCLVYVYSQDASVLGGSIGEMHAKKIVNLYAAAMKTDRLRRLKTSGSYRCPGWIRPALFKPDHGFRCDSPDQRGIRNLRRRYGGICSYG